MVVLGLGALIAIVACVLSLVVGGWKWPTVTVLVIVSWWALAFALPVGNGLSDHSPEP
jgi:hypothetical protein